ncbi:hypothetical protein JNK13_08475 [bacterium]|nr:hypothetical protein [bacterium]
MGKRGKDLDEEELGENYRLSERGLSARRIGYKLKRHHSGVMPRTEERQEAAKIL